MTAPISNWRSAVRAGPDCPPCKRRSIVVPERPPAPSLRVWTDAERKQWSGGRMVEANLRKRVAAQLADERRAWEAVRTRADWERFRDPRLAALRASLGPMPERTPLRAAVTRRTDLGDGFVIENVVFESRPHLLVTANLYLPAKIAGRIPAIVMVHSHHAPRTQSELQDIGMTWARAGRGGAGAWTSSAPASACSRNPWPRESYHARYALGMQLLLAGDSLMKWMVWDLMRGIDLLLERPYIDPKRIVMIGAVAGGGDPAAVTAALDPRIAAVVPFNFGEAGPEEHYTTGPRPYDAATADPGWGSWETTRNLAAQHLRAVPSLVHLRLRGAARRSCIRSRSAGPRRWRRSPPGRATSASSSSTGARDRLAEVHGFGPFPGPGECTNVGVVSAQADLPGAQALAGYSGARRRSITSTRTDAELAALTPALAAEREPQPAAEVALAMVRERARPAASAAQLRAALQAKLGDIEPAGAAQARTAWSREVSGFAVDGVSLETEPGIHVPAAGDQARRRARARARGARLRAAGQGAVLVRAAG